MSAASDLIERLKKETGQRVDDDLADDNGLFTWCRVLGKEQASREMLVEMLRSGMSLGDIKALMG